MYKHIELDYNLNLSQRLDHVNSMDLTQFNERELEFLADYILHLDKELPKQPSKHIHEKTQPAPNDILNAHKQIKSPPIYTKPKPIMHTSHPIIQQYIQSIAWLSKTIATNPTHPDNWKLKRWRLQHNLDMGLANAALYPTSKPGGDFTPLVDINLDEFVDLTNSFHVAKLIDIYSDLRQSDQSNLWIQWIEDEIIEKTPLYDWQKHLLKRRIDKVKQITIAVELAKNFNKVITPSTMSQAMRTIYRQIAITAERELYAFNVRQYEPAWRICHRCKKRKLIQYDYYPSKPNTCKQCLSGSKITNKEKVNGNAD